MAIPTLQKAPVANEETSQTITYHRGAALSSLALLVVICWLGLVSLKPPPVMSENAPAADFSSSRAMKHVRAIAAKPRPVGSTNHLEARNYILDQLRQMGLQPEIQVATVTSEGQRPPYIAATVHNLIARLPGTASIGAILLTAHYDSVPTSPGASDDGAGVATLLETLRAITSHTRLQNEVIFLFTDGEEIGLMGARAFVNEHPLAKAVKVVLNFEARGTYGPSLMFETSPRNAYLMSEFSKSSLYPISNSLMYEIYRLMPNDTDFSVFKEAGYKGFNFAYVEGANNYHTVYDDANRLDERSLQHHGHYAVNLARHFGNLSFDGGESGSAVFFNLFGRLFVTYSSSWIIPTIVLTILAFLAVVAYGAKTDNVRFLAVGKCVSAFLVCIFASLLLSKIVAQVLQGVQIEASLIIGIFTITALTTVSAACIWALKTNRLSALVIAVFIFWLLALLLASVYAPGGSYFFTWPLLASLLGAAYTFTASEKRRRSKAHCLILSIFAAPGLLIVLPMAYLMTVGLGLGGYLYLTVILVLQYGLLIPILARAIGSIRWAVPFALLIMAVISTAAVFVTYSDRNLRVRRSHIFYGLNADEGRAVWGSITSPADEWASQFCTTEIERRPAREFLPFVGMPSALCEAPVLSLAPPYLKVIADKQRENKRILEANIGSLRGASLIVIQVDKATPVHAAMINKLAVGSQNAASSSDLDHWGLSFYAPPKEGINLSLEVPIGVPVKIRLIDAIYELPFIPGLSLKPRPANLRPMSSFTLTDSTLVGKSYIL
jgi:hypothetical protein